MGSPQALREHTSQNFFYERAQQLEAQSQAASAGANTTGQSNGNAHVVPPQFQPTLAPPSNAAQPPPGATPHKPLPAASSVVHSSLSPTAYWKVVLTTTAVLSAGAAVVGLGVLAGLKHASWVPKVGAVMHKISAVIVVGHHPVGVIIFGVLGGLLLAFAAYKTWTYRTRRRHPDDAQVKNRASYNRATKLNLQRSARKQAKQQVALMPERCLQDVEQEILANKPDNFPAQYFLAPEMPAAVPVASAPPYLQA